MRRVIGSLAAVLALGLMLSACETETPYQPLASGNAVYGGFSDQKLDDTHVRVSFQGNDSTSRDQVNNYLLYRAAEVTVKQGFDWFEMVDRHTKDHAVTFGPAGYGYWSPYWRVRGRAGWGFWGPGFGPDWGDYDLDTVDRYQAVAEIGMGHGPKPADDARAFDARAVMQTLSSQIVRPK